MTKTTSAEGRKTNSAISITMQKSNDLKVGYNDTTEHYTLARTTIVNILSPFTKFSQYLIATKVSTKENDLHQYDASS